MVKTLLASERHMYALVSGRSLIQETANQTAQRAGLRTTVTGERFITKPEKILAILRSLDRLIVKYQSDKNPISEVLPEFSQPANGTQNIPQLQNHHHGGRGLPNQACRTEHGFHVRRGARCVLPARPCPPWWGHAHRQSL